MHPVAMIDLRPCPTWIPARHLAGLTPSLPAALNKKSVGCRFLSGFAQNAIIVQYLVSTRCGDCRTSAVCWLLLVADCDLGHPVPKTCKPLLQAGAGQDASISGTNSRAWGCSGTPAVSQSAGPPQPGKSRTAMPGGGCSDCPGQPLPPRLPGRLHPPASASGGRLHRAPLRDRHLSAKGSQAKNRLRVPSRRYS